MFERMQSTRAGVICALIFAACVWIAWPVAEMGFVDDWSYIKTAQVFAQTGHLVYNGWATAMLGWQIPWGALFIRIFGFSFTAAKASTLPVAMATLVLFYAILSRFGVTQRNAVLGTLTLGLSPMMMPLAASYMTDVPGLFVIVVCLYCCKRAVDSGSSKTTISWLCCAAIADTAGGTVRQIAWLGALVMIPCTGWLLRNRRGVLPASCLLWAGSTAGIVGCLRWFAHQPYSIPESITIPSSLNPFQLILIVSTGLVSELFCTLLMILPVLIAWLPQTRRLSRSALSAIAVMLCIWTFLQWSLHWNLPWIPHLLFHEFSTERVATMGSDTQHLMLPVPACLAVSALIAVAGMTIVVIARGKLRDGGNPEGTATLRQMFWLLAPFTLGYAALLAPRAIYHFAFDRYALGLLPVALIVTIRLYEQLAGPRLPAGCFAVVAVYAVLGIMGTHDWFAWQRARLAAIDEVIASGVPRTEIQGGFEYDGWTQLESGGHINDERIKVPPGAYQPHPEVPQVADACKLDFAPYTSAIHPKFSVVFGPMACLNPSQYPPVQFRAWLPPFRRIVYVQQIPAPG
jgi:hypothetical protein